MSKPCLAAVLINPKEPQYAASYHWCKLDEHPETELHDCYCGIKWSSSDLLKLTDNMRIWRTGKPKAIRRVSGRMMG